MAQVTLDSGLRLSYVDRRRDGVHPPVVLLPGPTDSWRAYQPVLDHLTAQTSVIAVSQRGHGDSDKPATGYTGVRLPQGRSERSGGMGQD